MTRRKVFISDPAKEDVRRLVRYIRLDKPIAARNFKQKLKLRIRSLERLAERGRKIPELKGTVFEDYRELILPPCRILYRISAKDVFILRILHSRMVFQLY